MCLNRLTNSPMLRRRKRAIGSDDFVTVDFNPRNKNEPLSKVA